MKMIELPSVDGILKGRGFGPQSFRDMRTGQWMGPPVGAPGACGNGGRQVPGFGNIDPSCEVKKCRWISVALQGTVGAAGTATLAVTPNVVMCLQRIVVVTTGTAGFTLANLFINNKPQWVLNNAFHSDSFAPGADGNDELPGDCIVAGSTISVTVINLDGANGRSIFIRLSGPSGE